MQIEEEIKKAIIKKAKGYEIKEIVEEYQGDEGDMVLTKKKVTKKHFPPDTAAAKMLLEMDGGSKLSALSDEELEECKQKYLKMLKEINDEATEN